MDRRHLKLVRTRCAIACVALLACPAVARAQALDTLHVRSFNMSSDTARPQVGQPFRLTISAHVDEQVAQLDNVTLPDLSAFDSGADERRCMATSRGTDCSETIVLVPKAAGTVTIASATMDAIDATDKKPSRFATNSVKLQIGAAPPSFGGGPTTDYLSDLFWNTFRAFVFLLALAVVLWYLLYRLTRPRAPKVAAPIVAAPPPAPAAAAPVADFESQFRALVEALRAEPTRPRALAVRHALRFALGAQEKETLADLVRRNAAGDRPQRITALRAIERASFCEDAAVEHNAREALPFLTL
jgi:hypothetical protein